MLYNKGNHAKLKYVQPQSLPLQGENGGKIYSTWNPGIIILIGFIWFGMDYIHGKRSPFSIGGAITTAG
jgi:hypothetical protein